MNGSLGVALSQRMASLTLQRIGDLALANARRNNAEILTGRSILDLKETLPAGRPALVIAAGPSLHRKSYVRDIVEHGFNGTIIATESSMSWCLRNGLVPDVVATVDPHPSRIVRWFGDPTLGVEEVARHDYYARQDLDPAFGADQLGVNRELLRLVDQYGPRMKLAISSSASEAVVRRAKQAGMELYWW